MKSLSCMDDKCKTEVLMNNFQGEWTREKAFLKIKERFRYKEIKLNIQGK